MEVTQSQNHIIQSKPDRSAELNTAINVYKTTVDGGISIQKRIPVGVDALELERMDQQLLEVIGYQESGDSAPMLISSSIELNNHDLETAKPFLGKRVITCMAVRFIIQKRLKLKPANIETFIDTGNGRLFVEGNEKEALYLRLSPLLDAKSTHLMSPAIFRSKLCEGIADMARALEESFPDSLPDFESIRILNAFRGNNIRQLSDLTELKPYEILRMNNLGSKSVMTVFVTLLDLVQKVAQDEALK